MLEYVPETVYRVARHFTKAKLIIPIIYVKVGGQVGGLLEHRSTARESGANVPMGSFLFPVGLGGLCSLPSAL